MIVALLCAVLLCADVATAGLAASVCEQSADKSLHAVRGECPSGSSSIQIAGRYRLSFLSFLLDIRYDVVYMCIHGQILPTKPPSTANRCAGVTIFDQLYVGSSGMNTVVAIQPIG